MDALHSETASIVHSVLAGDSQAYGQIVSRYQDMVWSVAVRALRNHADTEDLVQQVFLLAYCHLDKWDAERDFGAWIRGFARNQVKMVLRARSREYLRLQRYRSVMEAELGDRHGDVDAADQQQADRQQALRRCRDQLGDDADVAVRLRYEEGKDFAYISQHLGRSLEATRKLLSRVRLQLKDCVEQRLKAEPG